MIQLNLGFGRELEVETGLLTNYKTLGFLKRKNLLHLDVESRNLVNGCWGNLGAKLMTTDANLELVFKLPDGHG